MSASVNICALCKREYERDGTLTCSLACARIYFSGQKPTKSTMNDDYRNGGNITEERDYCWDTLHGMRFIQSNYLAFYGALKTMRNNSNA